MSRSRLAPSRLHIVTSTWARESNGLFDYDSRNSVQQTFRTNSSVQILRTGNHCLTNRLEAAGSTGEALLTVTHLGGER